MLVTPHSTGSRLYRSEQAHRIDIHDPAAVHRYRRHDPRPIGTPDQELPLVQTADPADEGWGGTQHLDVACAEFSRLLPQAFRHLFAGESSGQLVTVANHEPDQPPKRRVTMPLAKREFFLIERVVVLPARGADGVMLRGVGLDDDEPTREMPAGSPSDLRQQLERALGRAIVREIDARIGMHDPDRRYSGKIEPFGDHLRSDDDVDLATEDTLEKRSRVIAALHDVPIPAQHARLRKTLLHLAFDSLRSRSVITQRGAPARRARCAREAAKIATVTDQLAAIGVIDERDIAERAHFHVPAGSTLDQGRRATPVDEEKNLLAPLQRCRDRLVQCSAEQPGMAELVLESHVHDFDTRELETRPRDLTPLPDDQWSDPLPQARDR